MNTSDMAVESDPDVSTAANPDRFNIAMRLLFAITVCLIAWYGHISTESGTDTVSFGWLSLLPVISTLGFAILTHRSIEALLLGCIVGFILIDPSQVFQKMIDTNIAVLSDGITAWVICLTFLSGGLIALINFSGGTLAFSRFISRYAENRSQTLLASWVMGVVIFVDDYLNALAVSTSMKNLSDKFKISRQMLAYVVDSTSAPMCVLVPISTWAIFLIGLFEANQVFPAGTGFQGYVSLIPYIFYAWIAILMVPLVSMGWIPALGAMKKAEQDAAKGIVQDVGGLAVRDVPNASSINFILPLLVFLLGTWYFDYNTLNGVLFALVFTVPLLIVQKIGSLGTLVDETINGFSSMMQPMIIVIASFVLQRVNDDIGLSQFILDHVVPFMSAEWLPVVTFIVLSGLAFATGSFWGLYAIALPVIFPLTQALEADLLLTMGALVSAGVFGSHACFFGDATVITSKGAGCTPHSHAITQLPYAAIAAGLASLIFIVLA